MTRGRFRAPRVCAPRPRTLRPHLHVRSVTRFTRRRALSAAGGLALAASLPGGGLGRTLAQAATLRGPNSLPDPGRPAGTATEGLPFDHLVVVMMENHSFDNYYGMLPRRGQPAADGFTFDSAGTPLNSNPYHGGFALVQHATSLCQPVDISQAWTATHREVDVGRMDGFASVDTGQMLYWDEADLPLYYSLAKTFTLANRWFCSAPCQTYPNRRYLMAATSSGVIETSNASLMTYPANGTIFDRLSTYGVSWRNYYSDLPQTAIILPVCQRYPANLSPIAQFYADCAAGTLPAVSLVDPEFGAAGDVAAPLAGVPIPGAPGASAETSAQSGDEENPADIAIGENFVSKVVQAVLRSPAWGRTLLIYTYDEHGGYYDHVPPPAAIAPDSIPPMLAANDAPGGFNVYGVRVPTVVVSPYSRPGAVTSVVHDHTSVLATIEAKWNLPALTFRDANAATVADFLDTSQAAFATPPTLAAPGDITASEEHCSTADPTLAVHRSLPGGGAPGSGTRGGAATQRLQLRYYGRRHPLGGLLLELRANHGTYSHLVVEIQRGRHVVARTTVRRVGTRLERVVLRRPHRAAFSPGHYRLTVLSGRHTLVSRHVHVG